MNRKLPLKYTAQDFRDNPNQKWIIDDTIKWVGAEWWSRLTLAEQDHFIEFYALCIVISHREK